MKKVRKFYCSPNGDRWYLIGDASGEVLCGIAVAAAQQVEQGLCG
jgi:hypothetical protein